MSNSAVPRSSAPDRTIPAWAISVFVHGSLLAMLVLFLREAPRGAAGEPLRSTGIVLKQLSEEGELYQGEEDVAQQAEIREDDVAVESLVDALPDESAAPDVSEALPSLPAIGAGALTEGGLPNAGDFTLGGGGSRPQIAGGKARVRVFGVEGTGSKFVYVFDRSVSMDGPPLAAAKAQLIQSLTSLDEIHQFQIIFFNHRLRIFDISDGGQRIAFATQRNKDLAAGFVRGIISDGGTDRFAALGHALRYQPDAIFFLTDADDPMPAAELAEIRFRNRRAGASINTIEFGRGPPTSKRNFLSRLAEQSGGQYGYVDTTRLGRSGR